MTIIETKITLTLALEEFGTADDMRAALAAIERLGPAPVTKLAITLLPDTADLTVLERVQRHITETLADVPRGVAISVKTTTEASVDRRNVTRPTPMDRAYPEAFAATA